ncbi:MAG: hypothetical protein OXF90_13695 [Chloroflexi bacterium]|nr:hypothetical protein [Chloroflexota bacterium]
MLRKRRENSPSLVLGASGRAMGGLVAISTHSPLPRIGARRLQNLAHGQALFLRVEA